MQSDQINELAAALSCAQAKIEKADKDGNNPHFRSKYATLGSVWDACKDALTENDLAVVQTMDDNHDAGFVIVVTTLMHKSGQWIQGRQKIHLVKDDPQGYGSATTYARRYGLAAIVGVCPDDDDANAASQPPSRPAPVQRDTTLTSRGEVRNDVMANASKFWSLQKKSGLSPIAAVEAAGLASMDEFNDIVSKQDAEKLADAYCKLADHITKLNKAS